MRLALLALENHEHSGHNKLTIDNVTNCWQRGDNKSLFLGLDLPTEQSRKVLEAFLGDNGLTGAYTRINHSIPLCLVLPGDWVILGLSDASGVPELQVGTNVSRWGSVACYKSPDELRKALFETADEFSTETQENQKLFGALRNRFFGCVEKVTV